MRRVNSRRFLAPATSCPDCSHTRPIIRADKARGPQTASCPDSGSGPDKRTLQQVTTADRTVRHWIWHLHDLKGVQGVLTVSEA